MRQCVAARQPFARRLRAACDTKRALTSEMFYRRLTPLASHSVRLGAPVPLGGCDPIFVPWRTKSSVKFFSTPLLCARESGVEIRDPRIRTHTGFPSCTPVTGSPARRPVQHSRCRDGFPPETPRHMGANPFIFRCSPATALKHRQSVGAAGLERRRIVRDLVAMRR